MYVNKAIYTDVLCKYLKWIVSDLIGLPSGDSNLDSFLKKLCLCCCRGHKKFSGVANSKDCDCAVDFKQGARSLTNKQIARVGKDPPGVRQLTMQKAISGVTARHQKEQEDRDKNHEFEIDITRSLSNHKISTNSFLNCLQEMMKKHCSDSVAVQRIRLGR